MLHYEQLMNVPRTIHTGLTVADLESAVRLFGEALGFAVGEIRRIPPGDTLGHITGVAGAQARVAMVTAPDGHVVELLPSSATRAAPRPCDIGGAHLALEVDSIAALAQAVAAHGFAIAGRTVVAAGGPFAGRHVAYVRDGHGFTLELIGGP
jgi:catechol 2,3-dioxygenase-like lactoylglutathione lyase family enzyme